jgi:hypothetical protein
LDTLQKYWKIPINFCHGNNMGAYGIALKHWTVRVTNVEAFVVGFGVHYVRLR